MRARSIAPILAALFIMGALATIPYAAPIASWYMVALATLGVSSVVLARLDRLNRWNAIVIWPVLIMLLAWFLSIATSAQPQLSMSRSASMALFSVIFIAVQVAAWSRLTLRIVLWAVTATMLATVVDLAWQKITGTSLILGVKGSPPLFTGSQGNRNDLALISVLLPLSSSLLGGVGGIILYAVLCVLGSLGWVLSASRQTAIGWLIAFMGPLGARVSRKAVLISLALAVGAGGALVAMQPQLRIRAKQTWNQGLGDRQELVAFGLHLFWKNPVTGIGPGMYGTHHRVAAMNEWSWNGRKLAKSGMPWVHSLPVELLCETGLLGSAAVASILVATIRRLRFGFSLKGDRRNLAVAVATSLSALAVIGLVDLTFLKDWVRCVWWLLLGLAFVCTITWEQPKSNGRVKKQAKYQANVRAYQ